MRQEELTEEEEKEIDEYYRQLFKIKLYPIEQLKGNKDE